MKIHTALTILVLGTAGFGCSAILHSPKPEVHRYEDGTVSFRVHRDAQGRFHGKVLSYHPSGQLAEESYWVHGVPLRGHFFDENAALISEIREGTGWRHCPGHSEEYIKGEYVGGAH